MDELGEKLQKVMADLGLGSRREMERWIAAGRVRVNGEQAHTGQRVLADAEIELDGSFSRIMRRKEFFVSVRLIPPECLS